MGRTSGSRRLRGSAGVVRRGGRARDLDPRTASSGVTRNCDRRRQDDGGESRIADRAADGSDGEDAPAPRRDRSSSRRSSATSHHHGESRSGNSRTSARRIARPRGRPNTQESHDPQNQQLDDEHPAIVTPFGRQRHSRRARPRVPSRGSGPPRTASVTGVLGRLASSSRRRAWGPPSAPSWRRRGRRTSATGSLSPPDRCWSPRSPTTHASSPSRPPCSGCRRCCSAWSPGSRRTGWTAGCSWCGWTSPARWCWPGSSRRRRRPREHRRRPHGPVPGRHRGGVRGHHVGHARPDAGRPG